MAVAAATHEKARADTLYGAALRDAIIAGIVALAIFGPLIGLRTQQDMSNQLVVVNNMGTALIYVGLVAVGRFLLSAFVFPAMANSKLNRVVKPDLRSYEAKEARSRMFARIGLLFLVFYPAIIVSLLGFQGSIKWIDNFGIQILIYVMLGWGLNIVVGLAGLLDLGYVAFYAVGAYTYALLAINFDLSFWILLPLAGILAGLFGMMLGFPVLRLRGDYLAIVTLAFGEIIRLVLINWREFSGGASGISSIPKVTFFGIYSFDVGAANNFAKAFELPMSSAYYKIFLYYLILALALLTAFVTLRLRRLPIGRAWEALREDEVACRSLGINTTNTKLTAFAIGAMFAGFAGSFFAARQGFVSPESFVFMESAVIVAIVVLGGMGSMIGVAVAAAVMIGGTELLRELSFLRAIFGNGFNPDQFRMFFFGLTMVGIMIWKPRGFVSARQPTAFLLERRAVSGSLVKEGHG